jgi:hypothetical protein
VILLLAIVTGLPAGLGWAYWHKQPYKPPELRYLWLVIVAFLPQFVVVDLPIGRRFVPDSAVAVLLLASQIVFLAFVWLNRRIVGMSILLCGVALNLVVMAANGGFMPISAQTANRLVPEDISRNFQSGSRFGAKDILLTPQETRFEPLADRFLLPAWSPYQVAFSLGDVFIALGIFWVLAKPGLPMHLTLTKRGTYI